LLLNNQSSERTTGNHNLRPLTPPLHNKVRGADPRRLFGRQLNLSHTHRSAASRKDADPFPTNKLPSWRKICCVPQLRVGCRASRLFFGKLLSSPNNARDLGPLKNTLAVSSPPAIGILVPSIQTVHPQQRGDARRFFGRFPKVPPKCSSEPHCQSSMFSVTIWDYFEPILSMALCLSPCRKT